jgi:hypothetical protein
MSYYYYNGVGRCYLLPELPLEPPDCWAETEEEVQVQDQVQDADFDLEL